MVFFQFTFGNVGLRRIGTGFWLGAFMRQVHPPQGVDLHLQKNCEITVN